MENKNSFVLYTKYKEIVDSLTNEEAGVLFKAVFEYIATGNVPDMNSTLNLVFIPIRQDIDLNEKKWQDEKSKRAEAGRLGGLKTQENKRKDLSKSSNALNASSKSSKLKQSKANQADNVYVNVNDNVYVNDEDILTSLHYVNISNTEKNTKKRKVFQKPTIEEIQQYCTDRNNNVDPERFYDFYESKGWKVGKEPMKDWRACIRTWEKNNTTVQRNEKSTKKSYQDYEQREYDNLEEFYDNL